MKKLIFIAFYAVVSIGCNAQLLWKVSGNGLTKDSYIMGTHHVAPISILDSISGFDKAIEACDAVYGEIVQSEMSSPAAQQKIMAQAMAPADSTLNKIYSPEQYDSINTYLKELSGGMISLDQMVMLKPQMVATQMSLFESAKIFPNFNPNEQLDMTVQTLGQQKGKSLNGFETVDFQLDMLLGGSIKKQAEGLLDMARKKEKIGEFSRELAKAYIAQDLETMLNLMLDPEMGTDPEDQAKMIDDRNEAWKNTLVSLMPEQSIFVCVGAGHLPGEKGLLNLLKQAGYTVEPMK